MSSRAYQACTSQTPIGRLVRGSIDSRLALCNGRLVALHREMLGLPHRSVPLVRSVSRALYQWWTANEPEEITSIRLQLNAEAIAFGEWLSDLKSFYWASRLILAAKAKFCWKDLDELLNSGSTLLKEIHVDKIIIIEPLQGDQLNVPIRFVKSFEDIHRVVQFACHGTLGAKYIDSRRYQLDDAETNTAVNPERFAEGCLEEGKTFEVAMKLSQMENTSIEDCPRCGFHVSEEEEKVSGWIRCRFCKIQFNSQISEALERDMCVHYLWSVVTIAQCIYQVPCTRRVPEREATAQDAVSQDIAAQHQENNRGWLYMMFRRLLIEIQPPRRPLINPMSQVDGGALSSSEIDDWFGPQPDTASDVSSMDVDEMPLPSSTVGISYIPSVIHLEGE
ncbi:hypothetical protein BKA70DRAFT_358555 [Coprinopsis sp. MPI-PUGE-AT-0042]|nr:hypothetical protein BKA70DRAFT_358555 [Coprinopsis sp. MPI-PUGE-AT-0042]